MKVKKLVVFMLLLSFIFVMSGCSNGKDVEEEVIKPAKVVKVKLEDYEEAIEVSGNVKPSKLVKVAFKVPGVVSFISVEEGDMVTEGQELMVLQSSDYELNVTAARSQYESLNLQFASSIESNVNQAKANLDFLQTQFERVKRLHEKGAVAKKNVEELETAVIVAENKYQEALRAKNIAEQQLNQAKAAWDLAESKLDDTILKSPIKGTVVKKIVESGETIAPGYPTIVLGTLDDLELEIGVTDGQLNKIKTGADVKVWIYGLDKEVSGVIKNIEPTADPQTRTFPVKISLNDSESLIKPGMIGRVSITTKVDKSVLVPADCVLKHPDGPRVFVCNQEGIVEERIVKTGGFSGKKLQITEGLKEGELLVIEGQYKLKNGEKVKMEEVVE